MGFWGKLGKIALTAAPYVAAPFTGGASLAFAPMANQAVGAWSAADAKKNAAKGLAPSSFDKYLGLAGNVAGMAGGMGAFGKAGSTFGAGNFTGTNSGLSGWQNTLGKIGNAGSQIMGGMNQMSGGGGIGPSEQMMSQQQQPQRPGMERFNRQAYRQLGPVMGNMDQSNPNLAESIASGRMDAIKNQPWRGGYDTRVLGNDGESVVTSRMPSISPFQKRQQQFSYTPPNLPTAPVDNYGEAPEEDMGVEERRKRGIA
jgi:hypothetical protein